MSKSYKSEICRGTVSGVLEDGVSILNDLGSECTEAADNFPNYDHPKAEAFREAASPIEDLSLDVDLPEDLAASEVEYVESRPRRKRHNPSRASRRDNAVAMLQAGLEGMQAWLEDEANAEHEKRDEVSSLCTDVENAISEAEGVEFPGLYG